MKKKIAWLTLSCLMAVSLVLASCAPAPVEEEEPTVVVTPGEEVVAEVEVEEEEEEEVVEEVVEEVGPEMVTDILGRLVEAPQYGGTLTVVTSAWAIQSLDPLNIGAEEMGAIQYNRLITPDWLKSPQGTGESLFQIREPEPQLYIGELAESFEVISMDTVIFYLRKGIHWQDVPPVNGREFTADDVIETCKRWRNDVRHFHGASAETTQAWYDFEAEENPTKLAEWMAELEEHGLDAVADGLGGYTFYKIDKYTVAHRSYGGFYSINIAA